jgi:hypothetical protein
MALKSLSAKSALKHSVAAVAASVKNRCPGMSAESQQRLHDRLNKAAEELLFAATAGRITDALNTGAFNVANVLDDPRVVCGFCDQVVEMVVNEDGWMSCPCCGGV